MEDWLSGNSSSCLLELVELHRHYHIYSSAEHSSLVDLVILAAAALVSLARSSGMGMPCPTGRSISFRLARFSPTIWVDTRQVDAHSRLLKVLSVEIRALLWFLVFFCPKNANQCVWFFMNNLHICWHWRTKKNMFFVPRKIETRNVRWWRHSTAITSLQYVFGGKYDLIQLHRQIIHQNDRIFKRNWLIPSPPAISI